MPTRLAVVLSWVFFSGCAGHPERARTNERSAVSPARDPREAEALLQGALDDQQHARWDQSLRKAEEAAGALERQRDPRASDAYQVVGHAYLNTKRCDLASEAYSRALRIREAAVGNQHRLVAISLASLAEARRCAGDEAATVALFERAYGIFSRDPASLAERVDTADRLAALFDARGLAHRSAELLRDVLGAVRAARPPGDSLEWAVRLSLHDSLRALGDKNAAAALFDGLPFSDHCLPEPCPSAAPVIATAVVEAGAPGAIDNAAQVVASLRAPFRACYNESLRRHRRAFGRLQVTIGVAADGVPWRVRGRAVGPLDAAAVRCVLAVALDARFHAPAGGAATINVPLTFIQK
jgi:tetratricopeptide (TPR) repeat protein